MKNKVLIFLALCMSSHVFAKVMGSKTSADLLMEFHTMEKGHKTDWISFMQNNSSAKSNLVKNQIGDWVAFRNGQVKEFAALNDISEPAKNEFLNKELRSALALHEKHIAAWEKWARNKEDEARKLCDKHRAQLESFKKQLK